MRYSGTVSEQVGSFRHTHIELWVLSNTYVSQTVIHLNGELTNIQNVIKIINFIRVMQNMV